MAKLVLNDNSIDLLRYQDSDRFRTLEGWSTLNSYAKFLADEFTPAERELTVAFSGIVSYFLGLRSFKDIDVFYGGPKAHTERFKQFGIIDLLCFGEDEDPAERAWMRSLALRFSTITGGAPDAIATDPAHYGYYLGVKVVSIRVYVALREIRHRPKSMTDLVLLKRAHPHLVPSIKIPEWKIDEKSVKYLTTVPIMENQMRFTVNLEGRLLTADEIRALRTPVDRERYIRTMLWYLRNQYGVRMSRSELLSYFEPL